MTTRLTLVAAASSLSVPNEFPHDSAIDDALAARARARGARLTSGLRGWCGADRASRDTAVALGFDLEPVDALGAWRYGAWSGRTFDDVARDDPQAFARFAGDVTTRAPDGESFTDVCDRVARWFASTTYSQHHVLVATAPVARAVIAAAIDAGAVTAARLDLGPLAQARLQRHGGVWRLRALGRA
jgi:broad specificity phosphatase PhoE